MFLFCQFPTEYDTYYLQHLRLSADTYQNMLGPLQLVDYYLDKVIFQNILDDLRLIQFQRQLSGDIKKSLNTILHMTFFAKLTHLTGCIEL